MYVHILGYNPGYFYLKENFGNQNVVKKLAVFWVLIDKYYTN